MGRLIFSALLLVLLAVLVAFNLDFRSSVSLFGLRLNDVPVAAVALFSFAAGVVYSLFLYVGQAMHKKRARGLQERHRQLEEKERELETRAAAGEKSSEAGASSTSDPGEPASGRGKIRDWLKNLF